MSDTKKMFETKKIRTEDGVDFLIEPGMFRERSEFFEEILGNTDALVKVSIKSITLSLVLNYIHTGTIEPNSINISELIDASGYLKLDDLLMEVRKKIPNLICPGNCISLFNVAYKLKHLDILKLCYFYIWNHLDLVLKYADIRMLPYDYLKSFLVGNTLDVGAEAVVWNALMEWIEYDIQNRLKCVPALLCCLNLEDYNEKCVKLISNHPFVLENEHCRGIVSKVHHESGDIEDLKRNFVAAVRNESTKSPCHATSQPQILLSGYFLTSAEGKCRLDIGMSAYVNGFRTKIKRLASHSSPPSAFFYFDQRVYIYQESSRNFFSYSMIDREWRSLSSPPFSSHYLYSFIPNNGIIYVIWINFLKFLLCASSFNPCSGQWSSSNSVPLKNPPCVSHVLTAALGGLIYMVCAVQEPADSNVSFGKVYDTVGKTWSTLEMPMSHRSPCEMISFGNVLILLEGKVWEVKMYDTCDGIWTSIPKIMPRPYFHPKAVVISDKLIIHERYGIVTESYPICWDPEQRTWINASDFFTPPMYYNVITDEVIIRKHYRSLINNEWQTLVKAWK